MAEKMKQVQMIPGKRYRGYGYINNYKQFCFEPEATGSQAGREVALMSWELASLKKTKNYMIATIKIPLEMGQPDMALHLMCKINEIDKFIRTHEI